MRRSAAPFTSDVELIPQDNARGEVARALLLSEVFGTPYSEMPLYALERALGGRDEEYQLAESLEGDRITGVAIYGPIAGTIGTARIYSVAGSDSENALEAAIESLRATGTRLVIAELPDDAPLEAMRKLLLKSGFEEESRVEDLVRDGVALTFLRYEL